MDISDETREYVTEFLEPLSLVLLGLNQRHYVFPLLSLVEQVKNDPGYVLNMSIKNNLALRDHRNIDQIYADIEALQSLGHSTQYKTDDYVVMLKMKSAILDGVV